MHLKELLSFEMQVFLAAVLAFLISFMLIPKIIVLSRDKQLMANPVTRSSHVHPVPNLGGIGIYFAFMIPTLLISGLNESKILPFLTLSCIIIFLIGIKDDIYVIAPKTKLAGQIIAGLIMIVFANVRITNLHGIMSIGELSYIVSLLLSLFIYIAITNAINLMDGIDGLAASIGIVACLGLGVYFIHLHKINGSVACASLIGALSAFLIFNYAKGDRKIFMGDTGALIVGFILATYTIRFNEFTITEPKYLVIHSAPVVSMAILAIPIFDTIRVFSLRILRGKSPFRADKTHIHHELIANGYTHHQATTLISAFSVLLIILIYDLQSKMGLYPLLAVLIGCVALFYIVPFTFIYRQIDLVNRSKKYFKRHFNKIKNYFSTIRKK
jgi:UDP-GlcNAc:undecaprenyl-phosphate/decaprenyl-phosphate GlcNAc-1-phosphate transferase